jgi:hypothetical protein
MNFADMLREPIQMIQSMGSESRDMNDTDLNLLRQYPHSAQFSS